MSSLQLSFYRRERCELYRTEFTCAVTQRKLVCLRGNSEQRESHASFKWSPAVQALAILLLRYQSAALRKRQETISIQGDAGSPAASLDYALSKQPSWLNEMFGVDRSGICSFRRLVRRVNPERKRPGPVILSMLPEVVRIKVQINEEVIDSAEEFAALASEIELDWAAARGISSRKFEIKISRETPEPIVPSSISVSSPFAEHEKVLRAIAHREVSEMLRITNVFSRNAIIEDNRRLYQSPSYQRVFKKEVRLVSAIDESLPGAELIGMSRSIEAIRRALGETPLRIAVTPAQVASIAIFIHLKHVWGLPIEVDFLNVHTVEMSERILRNTFDPSYDFCAVSIGPALTLLKSEPSIDFAPFLALPKTSYRVVLSNADTNKSRPIWEGEYGLLNEGVTSSGIYFDELLRLGHIKRSRVKISHMEPNQAFESLSSGNSDLRVIQWFPHYHLSRIYHNGIIWNELASSHSNMKTLLFMRKRFVGQTELIRCLDLAIRNAWLELCENPTLLDQVVDLLFVDSTHLKFLQRLSGVMFSSSPQDLSTKSPRI